jgi:Helicase associated domain
MAGLATEHTQKNQHMLRRRKRAHYVLWSIPIMVAWYCPEAQAGWVPTVVSNTLFGSGGGGGSSSSRSGARRPVVHRPVRGERPPWQQSLYSTASARHVLAVSMATTRDQSAERNNRNLNLWSTARPVEEADHPTATAASSNANKPPRQKRPAAAAAATNKSSQTSEESKSTTIRHNNHPTATSSLSSTKRGWSYRQSQLQTFYGVYGHCRVSKDDDVSFPGLYQWTRRIRSRYQHPAPLPLNNSTVHIIYTLGDSRSAATAATAATAESAQKPVLSPLQYQALADLDFDWHVGETAWARHCAQLEHFVRTHGHARVPLTTRALHETYPGLAIWVRNQRREYQKRLLNSNNSSSTLTDDRVAALERLDFAWSQSHQATWMERYAQLQAFVRQHGHCHVPQDYPTHSGLGQWCMNQRTQYKRHVQGQSTALTSQRMSLLQDLGFVWNVKEHNWHCMLLRLRDYYNSATSSPNTTSTTKGRMANRRHRADGHVSIPLADTANRDLRLWLGWLRYCYHNNNRTSSSISSLEDSSLSSRTTTASSSSSSWPTLSEARIRAVETAIPNFGWSKPSSGGPSTEDWAKLFDAMRDRGIGPNVRPKQHWFEGMNPQTVQVKDVWTEQELLELWNQDSDNDDEDDYVDLRDQRRRGYN